MFQNLLSHRAVDPPISPNTISFLLFIAVPHDELEHLQLLTHPGRPGIAPSLHYLCESK